MAYTKRKLMKTTTKSSDRAAKIKKFGDGEKGDGKGKFDRTRGKDMKQEEEGPSKDTIRPCNFYLIEDG